MFESEQKDKSRKRWERRKGWKTHHSSVDSVPPNRNFQDPEWIREGCFRTSCKDSKYCGAILFDDCVGV